MKRTLQAVDAPVIDGASADRGAHQPRQVDSPYLTSHETLVYLRLSSLGALYAHIRENRLPVCRLGRQLRFDKRELDAWVHGFDSSLSARRAHVGERKAIRSFGNSPEICKSGAR